MPDHYQRSDVDEEEYYGLSGDEVPTVEAGKLCNAQKVKPNKGFVGYCNNGAGKGTDHTGEGRCKYHGGNNGPRDHENWGRGDQTGNGRNQKHALHANRTLFYNRLDDERQQMVDEFEAALIERYRESHNRDPDAADIQDLFEIAVGYVQRDYARDWLTEQMKESGNPMLEHVTMSNDDGTTTEFDKPNSILEMVEDNRREDRMQRKDKGLESGPDDQAADSMQSIAQALSSSDASGE